jgi:hypothetical protein
MSKSVSLYHKALSYQADNLACARLVMSDPVRYPGVLQKWARLVLARIDRPAKQPAANSPVKPLAAAS